MVAGGHEHRQLQVGVGVAHQAEHEHVVLTTGVHAVIHDVVDHVKGRPLLFDSALRFGGAEVAVEVDQVAGDDQRVCLGIAAAKLLEQVLECLHAVGYFVANRLGIGRTFQNAGRGLCQDVLADVDVHVRQMAELELTLRLGPDDGVPAPDAVFFGHLGCRHALAQGGRQIELFPCAKVVYLGLFIAKFGNRQIVAMRVGSGQIGTGLGLLDHPGKGHEFAIADSFKGRCTQVKHHLKNMPVCLVKLDRMRREGKGHVHRTRCVLGGEGQLLSDVA